MNDEMREPTEDELRAAFEEQLRQVRVEDVILQTVATLVNLGARRLGLIPEEGGDPAAGRDLVQARLAIEGARALSPLCPEENSVSIREALSQLQLAYARAAGDPDAPTPGGAPTAPAADAPAEGAAPASPAGDPAEAERSKARSKIWTPPGS